MWRPRSFSSITSPMYLQDFLGGRDRLADPGLEPIAEGVEIAVGADARIAMRQPRAAEALVASPARRSSCRGIASSGDRRRRRRKCRRRRSARRNVPALPVRGIFPGGTFERGLRRHAFRSTVSCLLGARMTARGAFGKRPYVSTMRNLIERKPCRGIRHRPMLA